LGDIAKISTPGSLKYRSRLLLRIRDRVSPKVRVRVKVRDTVSVRDKVRLSMRALGFGWGSFA